MEKTVKLLENVNKNLLSGRNPGLRTPHHVLIPGACDRSLTQRTASRLLSADLKKGQLSPGPAGCAQSPWLCRWRREGPGPRHSGGLWRLKAAKEAPPPPPRASRQNRPCRILTGAPEAHLGAWSAGLCANKLLLVKAAQQGSRVTAAENMNPCRFPLKQCEASRGLKLNPTECWCSSSK